MKELLQPPRMRLVGPREEAGAVVVWASDRSRSWTGAEVEEVERMSAADGVWNESMVLRALVMASSPSFVSLFLFPPKPKANPRLRAGAAEP